MITPTLFTTPRTVPVFQVGTDPQPRELVWILHGLGERAADLAQRYAPLAGPGRVLLVPEGLSRSLPRPGAPRAGASWSTGDDVEIDLLDNLIYLDALRAQATERLRPERQVLVGFSQGGLMASRWLAQRRHTWARVVFWGSGPGPDVDPAGLAAGLGSAELILALGDRDAFITQERRAQVEARLESLGRPWQSFVFAGGHEMPVEQLGRVLGGGEG